MILNHQYHNGPDGLGGNDDCGQMSAWYIFSSLGFYPVAPSSDEYWIGSPAVQEAKWTFEDGKVLSIKAVNQSPKNVYVKKVVFNGKEVKGYQLKHQDIVQGGELIFYMSAKK